MKTLFSILVLAALSVLVASAFAVEYDLVVNNGRVMDPETMYDAVANVGITDGKIAVITQDKITGKETIDATGLVVAPGFIDGHQHCIEPYQYRLMLRDGRTTLLDTEIGAHGPKLDEWYKRREGKAPVNYGVAVAHEFARAEVLDGFTDWKHLYTPDAEKTRSTKVKIDGKETIKEGWSKTRPNLEQGNQILSLIDEGLAQGALGIGSTVGYMRAGVSAREIFELQKLGGLYGRFIAMHFRYTPGDDTTEVNGIQEMLANAAALGTPAIASHFNNPGYNMVHELMVRMRERGYNVWGEIYPYAAGSTALNAVFLEPEVWVQALGNKYEDTLQDVATGEFYTQNSREEMLKKEPARLVLVYKSPESAIVDWLRMPGVAIGSDGMPMIPSDNLTWDTPFEDLPNTHPRTSGSFATVLRLSRENNIPLMQAISMTSYNYAKPLGEMGLESMQVRGRMQEGMVADITIFDPETVRDNSTYANGRLPSTGILHVLVNGVIVMKDQEPLKDVNPGQPIRFEPVKSKFEPLTKEGWTQTYYASPIDFGGGVPGSQPAKTRIPQEDQGKESTELGPNPLMKQAVSADEVARQLADPNSVLGSLNFNLDYITYKGDLPGASDQSATRLTFQPVFPYPINDTTNFYLRPAVPVVIAQDVPKAGGFDNKGVELGDIGFDAAVGKSLPGGYVVVGGIVGTLPTATDDALGLDQWLLGPEVAFGKVAKWGVVGLLVSHQWDVAGEDSFSTSITGGQYFYTFNLSDGWQISSSPTFSYNHEAQSGQEWTFPLGVGVSKTTILAGRPWKFGLQYWNYIEQPDPFGPDWEVRFTVTRVVSLPWGNK